MLGEAVSLREILFWVSIMMIILFNTYKHISTLFDIIEELICKHDDACQEKKEW